MKDFDEPDSEIYRLSREGTLALLNAVDSADKKGKKRKASKSKPCEAVVAYLDASFLGPFLRSGREIPYMHNAGILNTFIKYLDSQLKRGAVTTSQLHQAHLKLLAYVTAIEASAPLSVFGNCLQYLAGSRRKFNFGIYWDLPSARRRFEAVCVALKQAPRSAVPREYRNLHRRLNQLINPTLRNSIAHATYRIISARQKVEIWKSGKPVRTISFSEVDILHKDAWYYQRGFIKAVEEFARAIHPECPYVWHAGPRY